MKIFFAGTNTRLVELLQKLLKKGEAETAPLTALISKPKAGPPATPAASATPGYSAS